MNTIQNYKSKNTVQAIKWTGKNTQEVIDFIGDKHIGCFLTMSGFGKDQHERIVIYNKQNTTSAGADDIIVKTNVNGTSIATVMSTEEFSNLYELEEELTV